MKRKKSIYEKYIKRLLDIIVSLIGLSIVFPIMLVISIAIRINMGKPILYCQRRAGYLGKEFFIYKFRTMRNFEEMNCQKNELLFDGSRITKLGAFLRKTSLDELPQLFNILKGDISVIGPRPLLVEYLSIYNEKERRRHDVKPGMISLAAVNGRNSQSWDSKFDYDEKYVNGISFKLDLMIFLMCIKTVAKREGIYMVEENLVEDSFVKRVEALNEKMKEEHE